MLLHRANIIDRHVIKELEEATMEYETYVHNAHDVPNIFYVLALLRRNGTIFCRMPPKMRDDHNLLIASLEGITRNKFTNSKDLRAKNMYAASDRIRGSKKICLQITERYPELIKCFKPSIRNSPLVMDQVVSKNGLLIYHASRELKQDVCLVTRAMAQNSECSKFVKDVKHKNRVLQNASSKYVISVLDKDSTHKPHYHFAQNLIKEHRTLCFSKAFMPMPKDVCFIYE